MKRLFTVTGSHQIMNGYYSFHMDFKEKDILMNKKSFSVLLLVVMFIFAGSRMVRADDGNLDDATKARIAKVEQGPSTIDVSKYPQKIQDIYTDIFSQKCMQCHRLSRPINSDYALPSEWESYVKLMIA